MPAGRPPGLTLGFQSYSSCHVCVFARSSTPPVCCYCRHSSPSRPLNIPTFRLKHQNKPLSQPPNLPPDAKPSKAWISGVIYPDDQHLQRYNGSKMILHTTLGDIEIQLLPGLAPASIRELTRMAWLLSQGLTTCSNCRIYRPEPNFLVQGLMEAAGSYVAIPRHPNPQQPMKMPRGMVCWAGGTGGPHWFVNVSAVAGFRSMLAGGV